METMNMTMDERIVRLNEIISTKLSSISKGKREFVKAQKAASKYILENWDNAESAPTGGLYSLIMDDSFKMRHYELYCIAISRYDQLTLIARAKQEVEDSKEVEEESKEKEEVKTDEQKEEQAPAASSTPRVEKSTTSNKAAKSKHEVGDIHPSGKWVWTEYKPGKFDWRGIKDNRVKSNSTKPTRQVKPKVEKPVRTRTIEEILNRKPDGMSNSQQKVFKLLRKGYRFDESGQLQKENDRQVVAQDIVEALFRRMKVTDEEKKLFVE